MNKKFSIVEFLELDMQYTDITAPAEQVDRSDIVTMQGYGFKAAATTNHHNHFIYNFEFSTQAVANLIFEEFVGDPKGFDFLNSWISKYQSVDADWTVDQLREMVVEHTNNCLHTEKSENISEIIIPTFESLLEFMDGRCAELLEVENIMNITS